MKTEEELRAYFEDFKKHHERIPKVLELEKDMLVFNSNILKVLYPWKWEKESCWLDYWRAFANSKGQEFSLAQKPDLCPNMPNALTSKLGIGDRDYHNDNIDGALVYMLKKGESKGIYVIPLCSTCINKCYIFANIPLGTKLVEVLDPKIINS